MPLSKDYEFSSERLRFRGIRAEDAEAIVRWRSDPANYRNFLDPRPLTLEGHLAWFEGYLEDGSRYDFMVIGPGGEAIGTCGLSAVTGDSCEVSYMIGDESARGKGYAAEAARAMAGLAFSAFGVSRVEARILPGNAASARVAERAGFAEVERVYRLDAASARASAGGPGLLAVRADAGPGLGAGHVMRCAAVASAWRGLGGEALFAAACGSTEELARSLGFGAFRVEGAHAPGEPAAPGEAGRLAAACRARGASWVLVDTYAAGPGYLGELRGASGGGFRVAYVDDLFRYDRGSMDRPQAYDVDAVLSYGFGASEEGYREAYGGRGARLLVGPGFAPVRGGFAGKGYRVREEVGRVLVTSGATNPDGALEEMASACRAALPGAEVLVVVGPGAGFDASEVPAPAGPGGLAVLRAPADMAAAMASADLAVSAAGSTLYELACMGVPTVAVPVVDNQRANALGWAARGFPSAGGLSGSGCRLLREAVAGLAADPQARREASASLRAAVDGRGARRVVEALVERRRCTSSAHVVKPEDALFE